MRFKIREMFLLASLSRLHCLLLVLISTAECRPRKQLRLDVFCWIKLVETGAKSLMKNRADMWWFVNKDHGVGSVKAKGLKIHLDFTASISIRSGP
jgi:uncharacterized membrane protein YfhO